MTGDHNDAKPISPIPDNADQEYEVGYGKPPKANQFKPGHSGNPKGKRKRPKTAADVVEKLLQQKVEVNAGGRKKRLPLLEVLLRTITTKAAKGDLASARFLLELFKSQQEGDTGTMESILSEADSDELIESFIEMMGQPTLSTASDE